MTTFINSDKLFLDETSFKSMVPSSRNITDTQTIYYCIALSQKQSIKNLLGDDLYADMVTKYTLYVDSGTSMETHYSYLMENYLKPILSFSTYKRLINNLSFKLKEGGLRYSVEQTSELALPQDRGTIIQEITADIDTFIKDMKKYIYDNRVYFPLYDQGFEGVVNPETNFSIGKVDNPAKNRYSEGEQNDYYKRWR
jgi:hypothetical protein